MKRNQAKWIQWYLANTGKEWHEGDEGLSAPDFSSLTPKQADVGALLYRRYVNEKMDAEDKAFAEKQATTTAIENGRAAKLAADSLGRYWADTARAKGLAGTDYAQKLADDAAEATHRVGEQQQEELAAKKERILGQYVQTRDKRDARLTQDLDATDSRYAAMWRANWNALREKLQQELAEYADEHDEKQYTPEGIEAVKERIENNRRSLGDRYQEAMEWADALPVYTAPKGGKYLSTKSGEVFVSDADLAFADVVRYRKGAGASVDKNDTFSLEYNQVRYYGKAEDVVEQATAELLAALAAEKGISPVVGTLLYYRGALYIYDGTSRWRKTKNVGAESTSGNISHLLRQVQSDMNR